jgi:hypothetical protein
VIRPESEIGSDVLGSRPKRCPLTNYVVTLAEKALFCSTTQIWVDFSLKESSETFRAQGDIKPV